MNISIIDLKDLSAPLTKLVEVVASGIGTLYAPIGTVKQARADVAAKIIRTEGDEKVASLENRATARLEYREALRQMNVEAIVVTAAEQMPPSVSSAEVEKDWTLQFFDAAQDVCDKDMQILWAKILAGEVSQPGSYARRTIQFLRTMNKEEADGFTQFCGFCFRTGTWPTLLEESLTCNVMKETLGTTDWLRHFVSIGLLSSNTSLFHASSLTGMIIHYFDESYTFDGPPKPPSNRGIARLELHAIMRDFSQIGQELAQIAGAHPVPGFVQRIDEHLQKRVKVSLRLTDKK